VLEPDEGLILRLAERRAERESHVSDAACPP
jgi:hypothetical protein